MTDSWYEDDLAEGQRQWAAYELGAMRMKDESGGYPYRITDAPPDVIESEAGDTSRLRYKPWAADVPIVRKFETGATRDTADGKPDYEAYLSPLVIERYGEFMRQHQVQPDGTLRTGDNWQRGMPLAEYMKSAWRHMLSWWKIHRGYKASEGLEDALCALIFNSMGYLHETLKSRQAIKD